MSLVIEGCFHVFTAILRVIEAIAIDLLTLARVRFLPPSPVEGLDGWCTVQPRRFHESSLCFAEKNAADAPRRIFHDDGKFVDPRSTFDLKRADHRIEFREIEFFYFASRC